MNVKRTALEAVRLHAAEGYPYEICGMLVASKGSRIVIDVRRATNTRTDRPQDRYQIAPKEHRQIEDECDAAGLEIVGYYHSHPDHAAYASVFDAQDAWPNAYYLIAACMSGEVKETKVYQKLTWDSKEMVEEPLQVMSE